jgi:hypothetical protein
MDKVFEETHRLWLEDHKRRRKGDRLRRLEVGHAYLEKAFLMHVWWPAFGTLEDVHPEYEVRDYNDGRRYIDHVYKPKGLRLAMEADGFDAHVRSIDRWAYADNLLRDVHLVADGWTVLHFSSDIIKHRSRQAQQLLRQIVWGREGRLKGETLSIEGREVIRFAKMRGGPVTPKEIGVCLDRSKNTVSKVVRELMSKRILQPVDATKLRYRAYELTPAGRDALL